MFYTCPTEVQFWPISSHFLVVTQSLVMGAGWNVDWLYLHCSTLKQGLKTDSRCMWRSWGDEAQCPTRQTSYLNRDSSKTERREPNKGASIRWFRFTLAIYYGFWGPSICSSSPCGDQIRFLLLQRVYAALLQSTKWMRCSLQYFLFFSATFWGMLPSNLNFPFIDLSTGLGRCKHPQLA